MNGLYDLLRYWSSVFPSRVLHLLLHLLKRISQRFGLSTTSDRRGDRSSDSLKLSLDTDTDNFTSLSFAPIPGPSHEYIPMRYASNRSPAGSTLEIDTNDVPRTILHSPVQSPTNPLSPTVIGSARSPTSPTFPKSERSPPSLTPTTPLNSSRYRERGPVIVESVDIPAGPLAVHRGKRRTLPDDWHTYTHPEGLTYFVDHSRSIKVVTEAYISDHQTRKVIADFTDSVLECAASERWLVNRSSIELLVDYDEDTKRCSYYFVDDKEEIIFWLDELSSDSDELKIPDVSGPDHLNTFLRRLYWQHKEYFPVHNHLPEDSEQNLIATLTHNCIDVITATTSTSSYERSQLETILGVMKGLENSTGSEGQRNCIVARLWTEIYLTRFINYHGEKNARLFRTQIQPPDESSTLFIKFIFLFLFDAPSTHLATLKDLYVDEVIYSGQWRKTMETLVADWQELIFWTTVLLAANMSFLAIFNSQDDVMLQSHAVTCSIISTLCSTFSIVIGLLHVRKHRPQTQMHAADGNTYLQNVKHSVLGFQPLAIIYSLPYAFLMWAMATFVSAIILYTFKSGVNRISTFAISVLALALGCTLIWAISYFWEDRLGLLDNVRDLGGSLRWLSPMRLNRKVSIVTPRGHDTGTADDTMMQHWAMRYTASMHENFDTSHGV